MENCCWFVFYNIMGKVLAELALFSVVESCVLHVPSFLLSVLLWTIATSQSPRWNFDSNCKDINSTV